MASMPVETKMTGRQFVEAVVMGVHFQPVRAYKNPTSAQLIAKSDQQHDNSMGNGAILTS
jgi:hypothetical protein